MTGSLPTPSKGDLMPWGRADGFRAWRQAAYRNATIVWCLLLLCAYVTTLIRTPITVFSQVCLLSTLFMLTCSVLLAALRGSARGLTVSTSVLMLVRSLGYAGIGLGIVTLDFKPQLFAAPGSKSQVPLPTFSCLAVMLFDSIGLVHASAPWLQLCLQMVSATISNMSSGNTLASSMLMSLAVHGLCGLVSVLLERWDHQCFAAVLTKQRAAVRSKEGKECQGFVEGVGERGQPEGHAQEANMQSAGYATAGFQRISSGSSTNEHEEGGSSGVSRGVRAAREGHRGEEQQQQEGGLPRTGSAQEGLAAATVDSHPRQSVPTALGSASRQGLLHDLQLHVRGPDGLARLHRVNLVSARLRTRLSYEQKIFKHKVVMKVPDPVHPGNLPALAIPDLWHYIHASCPGCTVASTAVRVGCVLVTLDLRRDLSKFMAGSAACTEQGSIDADLVRAAQEWLQDTQLAAQLPASAAIQLQVDGKVMQMVLDASTQSWSITYISPMAAPLSTQTTIQALSPVTVMPPLSDHSSKVSCNLLQQQEKEQLDKQQEKQQLDKQQEKQLLSDGMSSVVLNLEVHASVCVPVGVEVHGWAGDEHVAPAAASDAAGGAGQLAAVGGAGERELVQERDMAAGPAPGSGAAGGAGEVTAAAGEAGEEELLHERNSGGASSSSGSSAGDRQGRGREVLCVLARIEGHGYARTRVVPERGALEDGAGEVRALTKVHISVPEHVAAHNRLCLLRLELWQGDVLLSSSSSILLPACMPGAASELQSLPWGCEGTEDLTDYITDLGHWLHQNYAGNKAPSPDPAAQAQQQQQQQDEKQQQQQQQDEKQRQQQQQQQQVPSPWEVGVLLLRQSVLWGLPSVSTLLVDTLMGGLPSAPTDAPFARLAHAPIGVATAAAGNQCFLEQDGLEITLQDIGALLHLSLLCPDPKSMLAAVLDWGRRWGSKEPGFAWRWNERSAVGVVPLDILATLPRDDEVLQMLLQDPVQSRALLAAALESAQEKEASARRVEFAEQDEATYAVPDAVVSAEYTPSATTTAAGDVPEQLQGAEPPSQPSQSTSTPAAPAAAADASAESLPSVLEAIGCTAGNRAGLLRSAVVWLKQWAQQLLCVLVSFRQGVLGFKQQWLQDYDQQQQQQRQQQQQSGVEQGLSHEDGDSSCTAAAAAGAGVSNGALPGRLCERNDADGSVSTNACVSSCGNGGANCAAPSPFSEANFRSWANAQASHTIARWSLLNFIQGAAALTRELVVSGYDGFQTELLTLWPLVLGYALCSLALSWAPQHSEVIVCALICCRFYSMLAFGAGWTPWSTILRLCFSLRLEYAVELVMMSVIEEVRISRMLPMRVALFYAYGLCYTRMGKTCPWGQSAILHLSCVAVRFVAERRMRNLYSLRLQRLFCGGAQVGRQQGLHKAQDLQ